MLFIVSCVIDFKSCSFKRKVLESILDFLFICLLCVLHTILLDMVDAPVCKKGQLTAEHDWIRNNFVTLRKKLNQNFQSIDRNFVQFVAIFLSLYPTDEMFYLEINWLVVNHCWWAEMYQIYRILFLWRPSQLGRENINLIDSLLFTASNCQMCIENSLLSF